MGSYAHFHENMLANLASLIWGSTEEETKPETKVENENEPACGTSPKDPCGTPTFRAATPSEVDEAEWVLVDRPASLSPMRTPSVREDSPMREDTQPQTQEQQVAVQGAPATRNRAVQRAAKLLEVIDVLRPAQKAQRRKEERRLKAKHLERSNKAREVAAAGNKRAKRCNMMTPAKFSRAVNNRKC